MPVTSRPTSTDFGSSGCWRENASSRCVSDSARRAPRIAFSAERSSLFTSVSVFAQVALQRFEIADDDREQIVEVMGHATGELADAFHLLRLAQPLLGGATFGEIARDLGKSDDLALRVPDCVDHHARPEPGAVLADAPAFRLVLAGARRRFERFYGTRVLPVLLGVEAREVLGR